LVEASGPTRTVSPFFFVPAFLTVTFRVLLLLRATLPKFKFFGETVSFSSTGVGVEIAVGVGVAVAVAVEVAVDVGLGVAVAVGVPVALATVVAVAVTAGVAVGVTVAEGVATAEVVGVGENVAVGMAVAVAVGDPPLWAEGSRNSIIRLLFASATKRLLVESIASPAGLHNPVALAEVPDPDLGCPP